MTKQKLIDLLFEILQCIDYENNKWYTKAQLRHILVDLIYKYIPDDKSI